MPWIIVAILAVPAVVIGLVVLITGGKQLPVSYTQYLSQFWLPLSLFVAGAAPYAVSRDLLDATNFPSPRPLTGRCPADQRLGHRVGPRQGRGRVVARSGDLLVHCD